MMKRNMIFLAIATLSLSACGAADRISNIGERPVMAGIEDPTLQNGYRPVSLPMPTPEVAVKQPNSLWASNRKNFFKDQRAGNIGDILTVVIEIADEAEMENETERTRNTTETAGLPNFLGLELQLAKVLPEAVIPGNLVDGNADSTYTGEGSIEREEAIDLQLAAL